MLTFPFPVKADINDEMSLPSIVLSYGDGNKQRSPDGLNLPKTIWNIQCPVASKSQSAVLQSFLLSVGNHVPFLWQSPRDTKPEFYYITGKVSSTYRLGGGKKPDFFVRSMQFECANIIIVPAIVQSSASGIFLLRVEPTRFYDVWGAAIVYGVLAIASPSKFGGAVKLESLDSITIPLRGAPPLIPPTGDWTIDFWFTSKGESNYGATFSLNSDKDRPLVIFREDQIKLKIIYGAGLQIIINAGNPSFTQIDYYGFQRQGSLLSAWKNGVMISSASFDPTIVIDAPTTDSVIGARNNFYANTGSYEEFRISHVAQNLAIVPTALFI